jgi:phosphoribosylformylglycinamidine cyclo-ligase
MPSRQRSIVAFKNALFTPGLRAAASTRQVKARVRHSQPSRSSVRFVCRRRSGLGTRPGIAAAAAIKATAPSPSYAESGVDLDVESASVRALVKALGAPGRTPPALGAPADQLGGFSGLIDFGPNTLLALCTDGVGSKLVLATQLGLYDGIPYDCVAMNVNDLLCIGAEPLAFVDYIAAPHPEPALWATLGKALGAACRLARVTLAGGETASLPDMVTHLDMSGTALGWLPRGAQLDGRRIEPGDLLLGLPSSGLHSNGYSLVRKVVARSGADLNAPPPFDVATEASACMRFMVSGEEHQPTWSMTTLGQVLLYPTAIYVNPIADLVRLCREQHAQAPCSYEALHGLAHITGGGLSNLLRWRSDLGFDIENPLPVHPEFRWLQFAAGSISDAEMYRVFNMGMGMVLVVETSAAAQVCGWLAERVPGVQIVGRVTESGRVRHCPSGVEYDHYG